MPGIRMRKYGIATNFQFGLIQPDGVDLTGNAATAAADTFIVADGAAAVATNNTFAAIDSGIYSLALDASEMEFTGAALVIRDATDPKAWLDKVLSIETYGHESGMHPEIGSPIMAELASEPGATPTVHDALNFLYMAFRNEGTSSTGQLTVKNDASTIIASGNLSDDGTTFTRGKMSST